MALAKEGSAKHNAGAAGNQTERSGNGGFAGTKATSTRYLDNDCKTSREPKSPTSNRSKKDLLSSYRQRQSMASTAVPAKSQGQQSAYDNKGGFGEVLTATVTDMLYNESHQEAGDDGKLLPNAGLPAQARTSTLAFTDKGHALSLFESPDTHGIS